MHRASEPDCVGLALVSARGRRPILHGPFLPWPPRGADSEQGPMTPEDRDQVGTRPRMRGDRPRRSQDRQAAGVRCHNFSVRTTLRATPATREELLYEIGNQLADFDPRYRFDSTGRMVITLSLEPDTSRRKSWPGRHLEQQPLPTDHYRPPTETVTATGGSDYLAIKSDSDLPILIHDIVYFHRRDPPNHKLCW